MKSFIEIESVEELIAQALEMSELEREAFFSMDDGEYTVKELVEETGRSRSMVQRALTDLHDKGVVVREGRTDRTIYYVYKRVPLENVRQKVTVILEEWHQEMKDLLNG